MTTFNFPEQLKLGNEGEDIFMKHYGHLFHKNNNKNVKLPDFIHKHTGALAEIKYDDSPRAIRNAKDFQVNFFVELYSNYEFKSLGGPFRAVEEGVDYYVYIFKKPFRMFLFDAVKFRDTASTLIRSKKYKDLFIKNKSWETQGYAIPIHLFKNCEIKSETVSKGTRLNLKK